MPTMPSVKPAGDASPTVRASAAATEWTTPPALQPGAETTFIPWAAHHGRSMWSVPIVAVATIRTGGTGQQCRIAAGSCANQKRVRLLDLFGRDGLARQVGYVGVGFEYAADIRYLGVGYYFHRISMGVCVFSREAPGRVRMNGFR